MLQKKILQERKMKNETEELIQLQQHQKKHRTKQNQEKKKKKANMYKCRLQALRTFRAANCGALTA